MPDSKEGLQWWDCLELCFHDERKTYFELDAGFEGLNPAYQSTSWETLLLLSRFSRVRPCVTPETAAHQAPLPLGFSRQEWWSGSLFPSPMYESEKWKWSQWVVSNSQRPHGLQHTRLRRPWDSPGKNTGVGCHCLLLISPLKLVKPETDSTKYQQGRRAAGTRGAAAENVRDSLFEDVWWFPQRCPRSTT